MDKTEQLITGLGGMENITSVTNCMTRVRVVVRSEEPVDEAALRALKDVMGIVHDRDRYYEIVVGPGKSRKYADQCHELGIPAAADDAGGGAGAGAGFAATGAAAGAAGRVTAGFVAGTNALTLNALKSRPHFLQKLAVSAPIVPH